MDATLFIVATPIGNLGDITLRAIETLKSVDIIACEDTRHTLNLLNRYEISKPLISYYKHKENEGAERILSLLDDGKNVALVSDAGMPCISDPGSVLVKTVMEKGYNYTVLPGANAAVCALALCGIDTPFTFIGFLPEKKADKVKLLSPFINIRSALVFYAAPHDINDYTAFLYTVFGAREFYAVKEISKIHEKVVRGILGEIVIENPRGEYVLIVSPATNNNQTYTDDEIKKLLIAELKRGALKKDAVKSVCEITGEKKNKVYGISLDLPK